MIDSRFNNLGTRYALFSCRYCKALVIARATSSGKKGFETKSHAPLWKATSAPLWSPVPVTIIISGSEIELLRSTIAPK